MKPLLAIYDAAYQRIKPRLFQQSAQEAHDRLLELLARADHNPMLYTAAKIVHDLTHNTQSVHVGGVDLPQPLILAAGMVKGHGFINAEAALRTVRAGYNIIPGWRSLPALVGPVEFGSFTRYPRLGNTGTVIWRDAETQSTQNRVGLKNPGAAAAAAFLFRQRDKLPGTFGINIAVSPGISDPQQETQHVRESLQAFLCRGIVPSWFTLNISCPNTEDDPSGNQTGDKTRRLCSVALETITQQGVQVPLWVKVGPGLAASQYRTLLRALADTGTQAVIATNTLPRPTPDDQAQIAGVGGGRLHMDALAAASILQSETTKRGYDVDVIGCGGVLDGISYNRYKRIGVQAVQYWSALVYRGPLAAAQILREQ
jgi:dihydroorotate dehydrogenase